MSDTGKPRRAFRDKDPMAPIVSDGPRHDFVIVPTHAGFRISKQGLIALVNHLNTTQVLSPDAAFDPEPPTGALRFRPGLYVHHIFAEGTRPEGVDALQGAVLSWSEEAVAVEGAPEIGPRHLSFRLNGSRYISPSVGFLERLHRILYLRPQLLTLPHVPAAPEGEATEPVPQG